MKHVLRQIFANGLGIYLGTLLGAVVLGENFLQTLALAAAALTGLNLILKPIMNLFLMPINILTLGMAGWLVKVVNVYIASKVVPGFLIQPFYFPGGNFGGFVLPDLAIGNILAILVVTILLGISGKIVSWIGD